MSRVSHVRPDPHECPQCGDVSWDLENIGPDQWDFRCNSCGLPLSNTLKSTEVLVEPYRRHRLNLIKEGVKRLHTQRQ